MRATYIVTNKVHLNSRQTQSFREEQALRERPLVVDPLRIAAEAGGAGHLNYSFR